MVALLKAKSKIRVEQKPRKTYEVFNFFKRQKTGETIATSQKTEGQIPTTKTPGNKDGKEDLNAPFLSTIYSKQDK